MSTNDTQPTKGDVTGETEKTPESNPGNNSGDTGTLQAQQTEAEENREIQEQTLSFIKQQTKIIQQLSEEVKSYKEKHAEMQAALNKVKEQSEGLQTRMDASTKGISMCTVDKLDLSERWNKIVYQETEGEYQHAKKLFDNLDQYISKMS